MLTSIHEADGHTEGVSDNFLTRKHSDIFKRVTRCLTHPQMAQGVVEGVQMGKQVGKLTGRSVGKVSGRFLCWFYFCNFSP